MKKVYMQVSTHWDREWYNSFQAFRYDLIQTTDKVLEQVNSKEILDNFVFDGQTIVLEDYLEIMPQNYDKIEAAVKDGSIKIGPWYVMPDEFLVSGESLIQNFLVGKQICEKFGAKPFPYGYVNDIFGHIAQFPQLLNQLGIKMAYLGRGVSAPEYEFRHFIWQSPDGSKCYTYKYPYNVAYVYWLRFLWSGEKTEEEKDEYVRNYILGEVDKSENGVVLLNITNDHVYLEPEMLDLIRRVKKLVDIEVVVTGLDGAYEDILSQENLLQTVCGELTAKAPYSDLMSMRVVRDSVSSYYPLKQANDHCQKILESEISPLVAYSHVTGVPIHKEFVQVAYKELLKNHPHDDICGCSSDQVHKDMRYRYEQVEQMAQAIRRDFRCRVEGRDKGNGEQYLLRIFNPVPHKREQVVTVDLEFPQGYPTRHEGNAPFQPVNMFRIYDASGNEVDYQILKITKGLFQDKYNTTPGKKKIDQYQIAFAAELNAFGMTEYIVKATKDIVRNRNTMCSGDNWAENTYARIEIAQDGTLTLTDKQTGKVYNKLHYFVDGAEAGNGWFHEDAANQNALVSSRFGTCTVEKIRAGSMVTTFRITKIMNIPSCMNYDTYSRSEDRTDLKIISEVSLKQDSGKIYIETKVENCAKDHQLKLLLPTHVEGDTYFASQAFYFAERTAGADPETSQWLEADIDEKAFDGIIYKTDKHGNGLAFVGSEGFHQGGMLADDEATISVVMFRSFGRVHMVNNPVEPQIQGTLQFRYTIVPMNEKTGRCDLLHTRTHDFRKEIGLFVACESDIEAKEQSSLMQMSGENVALSVIKVAEQDDDITIVRAFNTEKDCTKLQLNFEREAQRVAVTDLYEQETELLAQNVREIVVELQPYEIKTLAIKGIGRR